MKFYRFFFTSIILILIIPMASAVFDPYKPYLHNPIVPEHPKIVLQGAYQTALWPGAATYTYPFEFPAGTNGLEPAFSLYYNNQLMGQRPSVVGMTWSVTDNYIIRDVSYTPSNISDDVFKLILDGKEYQLIYDPSDSRYHTDIETFLSVKKIATGGNNTNGEYWIVTETDGTSYRFGYQSHSELISNLGAYTSKWSLDLVIDSHGNNIYYTYLENISSNDRGAVYLSKIEYNTDRSRVVDFAYEGVDRPDAWLTYENGNQVKESRRLMNIYVRANGALVRRYSLSYLNAAPTSRSFITSITLYGNDNISRLSVISFNYLFNNAGWALDTKWTVPDSMVFENTSDGSDTGVRIVDLNRDGFMDLIKNRGGSAQSWINDKSSGWVQDNTWNVPSQIVNSLGKDSGFRIMDLNGDGFDDYIFADGNTRLAYLNSQHGWIYSSQWLTPVGTSPVNNALSINDTGARYSDVNGDGFIDILVSTDSVNQAWLNNKSGWTNTSTWRIPSDAYFVSSSGEDQGVRIVDFNGDGLPDLVKAKGTFRKTWINNGTGWIVQASLWQIPAGAEFVPTTGGGQGSRDLGIRFADVNADGLIDIVRAITNDQTTWMNTGSGWVQDDTWDLPETTSFVSSFFGTNKQMRLADVNGDGLVDVVNGGHALPKTYISTDAHDYQLSTIRNNLGGLQSLVFEQSTLFNNTGGDGISDLGFNMFVIKSISENNGLMGTQGTNFTTFYSYQDGIYNYSSREFKGFSLTDEIKPSFIVRHYFLQGSFLKGKEYRTDVYGKNSDLFRSSVFGWQSVSQNNHSTVLLSNETTYIYDGNYTDPRITETDYSYDSYGNPTLIINKGDKTIQGDEYYEYYDYLYNISAWIVDKPQRYRFFDFDNVTKLRERTYRYDNLSYGSVPTRGDLTWEEHWLSNASANSTIKYTYENYGNLIERTDPNGNKSAYIYGVRDITHTYADRFVNAKNYSINYNYDLGTGNLLSETDANGYLTNYSYDLFGRIIKEIKPYDSAIYATKEYNYSFDGIAPELIKVSQRELTGTNNTFDSLYFYDGFGNLIQIKTEVNATARLEKDFFYDSERRLVREFNPYFVNSSESYSNPNNDLTADSLYYYDPLSRATYALYAGGGTERVVFDHSRVTTYDKNGNKKVYYVDAYGRVVRVIEYVDNNYYTTFYKYAPTGEIVQINDSLGNVYTYQYDSLGRKTKEINPDLGTWNYQYDAVGNLINQIDNRSINISLKYDNLNRLISKTSSGQSISYIYDRINGTLWKTITLDTTSEEGYDQRLRKINETMTIDGRNFTKKWTYDSLDRVVNETLPDNSLILYTYTSHGDLKTVGSIIDSVLYNEFSKPTQFLYHNGLQTNISYDSSTSRVKQIKTSTYQNINYHYDLVGNILLINDTANNFAKLAIYDTIDRLSYSHVIQNQTSTIFNYTYDALGDILLTSGRVNVTYYYGLGPLHAPKKIAIFATLPSISFVFPTPSNGSTQSGDSISVNISSIHDTSHYVLFDFNKDLRLWMRMDDLNNSGDLVDLSSYGNNGTRSGGALISSLGKFGNSITFNSISDSVRIPDSPSLDINQSITVSFWFKGTNATYNQNFVSKYDGISSNQITWQATLASGGICNGIGFYVSESGNASDRVYIRNCNQTYQDGLWHHFVGIFDAGKNISLYIDGNTTNSTLVGAVANVTAIYTNNQNIYVGSRNNDTYQGSIDDLAIFARALSSSEVLSLYGTNVGYYNDFVNLASKNYTLQGYTVDTYGLKNQTEERKVALSNVLNLTSLAYVYKNTTRYVFRFVVNNTGVSTLSNISWVFNTGQNIESSQYNTTLTGGEDLFVYVYHNYTSSGNYTVIASAQSGEIFTSKSLVVNV